MSPARVVVGGIEVNETDMGGEDACGDGKMACDI